MPSPLQNPSISQGHHSSPHDTKHLLLSLFAYKSLYFHSSVCQCDDDDDDDYGSIGNSVEDDDNSGFTARFAIYIYIYMF